MRNRRQFNFINLLRSDKKIRSNVLESIGPNDTNGIFSRIFNNIRIVPGPLVMLTRSFPNACHKEEWLEAWHFALCALIRSDLLNSEGTLQESIIDDLKGIIGEETWDTTTKDLSKQRLTELVVGSYITELVAGETRNHVGLGLNLTGKLININDAQKELLLNFLERHLQFLSKAIEKDGRNSKLNYTNLDPRNISETFALIKAYRANKNDIDFMLIFDLCFKLAIFNELRSKLLVDNAAVAISTIEKLVLSYIKQNDLPEDLLVLIKYIRAMQKHSIDPQAGGSNNSVLTNPSVEESRLDSVCLTLMTNAIDLTCKALEQDIAHLSKDLNNHVSDTNYDGINLDTLSYSEKKAVEKINACRQIKDALTIKALNTNISLGEQIAAQTTKIAMAERLYKENEKVLDMSRTHPLQRLFYALFAPVTLFVSMFWSPDNLLFLNNKSRENRQLKTTMNYLFFEKNKVAGKHYTEQQIKILEARSNKVRTLSDAFNRRAG